MAGDRLTLLQFADRLGLNLFALLTIGFALHAAFGVMERDAFGRLRWLATASAVIALIFVAMRFLILLAQMGDGSQLIDPELAPLAWSALGNSSLLIGGGLVVAAGAVWLKSRWLALLGAIAAGGGFALTGHTQGLIDPGLAPVAVAAHVLLAGFWIAAPVSLYPFAHVEDARLIRRLERFSAIAVAAIPLLVVLGIWLSFALTRSLEGLLGSAYGQLLLGKLAVGVAGMAVGAVNKQVLTRKLATSPETGRRWLRITLVTEAVLFASAIAFVSAATTFTGPPE